MKNVPSLYNPRHGGYLYTPVSFLWTILPLQLLHIRGIFSPAWGILAIPEVLPDLDGGGPPGPRLVPDRAASLPTERAPTDQRLSPSCPSAGSSPDKTCKVSYTIKS